MDIAAMSTVLSQAKIQQQANFSVMKMAMDAGETKMNDMVQMMQQNPKMLEHAAQPHLGSNIDLSL